MMRSKAQTAVIVSYARTPVGKFRGGLSALTAPHLGSIAIRGALSRISEGDSDSAQTGVKEAILGNVVSAGVGQAPCRQAVLGTGLLDKSVICTTINKVCASGMKSAMLAAQAIQSGGTSGIFLAGGMESMSNVPHYLTNSRSGKALGHTSLLDGVIHDGLWDVYNDQHMGMCAEKCASDFDIGREAQDAFCIETYRRAQAAADAGFLAEEIVPVTLPPKRKGDEGHVVTADEEPFGINLDKVPTLRPAFLSDGGTVTAANASSLNDGAAALLLMSEQEAIDRGLTPLARILGFGDAARDPVDFTIAPSLAVPVALRNAGVDKVDYHEVNEAFSVVVLANAQLLDLDLTRVNVFGGAVSLGHPIGMSGARIIGALYNVLKHKDATLGCASICNGGGGASAIVLERLM